MPRRKTETKLRVFPNHKVTHPANSGRISKTSSLTKGDGKSLTKEDLNY
jgi:hypothetical protein